MSDYRPITCAVHEGYQLAAMRRERLRVRGRDAAGAPLQLIGAAVDVYARQGEEFLVLEGAGGERLEIRLDRIDGVAVAGVDEI